MLRPQPIGVFPGTTGFLLLPSVPDEEKLLPLLLRGDLPEKWPESWRFFALSLEGKDRGEVLSLLPPGPVGIFNRFILEPTAQRYALSKEEMTGELALLLDAAAWRFGFRKASPSSSGTTGEIRAFLLVTQAYEDFQRNQWPEGLDKLWEAAGTVQDLSPVFSSRLYAEWAAVRQNLGDYGTATVNGYLKALSLLENTSFHEARAELWFQLGTLHQGGAAGRKAPLLEAIRCYHEVLKVYRKETYPESYAMVHMNLALSYLSMPSLDRSAHLRTAMAVQSLREALQIFKKETHPDLWASATMNMANALQHLHSSHPEENLWEAVALYEEVLSVRRPEEDLLGYARVLANQGNALAHLGAFSRAEPRLQEAIRLFRAHGEEEAAESVEAILEEIERIRKGAAANENV
ncbi:Tetratricopeptide family protein [[Clostridium] ultunense Esp]|nr:Tetratricopeptide family protein [[Clostridium] ultunense Esp]